MGTHGRRRERRVTPAQLDFACRCDAGSGSATVTAFDTHIVGCRVASTANDCNTTQRDFIDAQRPAYSAGTATQALVRLTSATSCADIRAALP